MRIVCIGGGPAGLYFAISMKLRDAAHEVTVVERNRPDDTFGWGVVFSDQTMDNLRANDAPSADQIADSFAHWDVIDIHFKGTLTSSGGHGFSGIGRKRLLHILQERARALKAALTGIGLPVIDNPSHIVPVLVGDPVVCKALSDRLLADWDIYAQPINYPTVPRGTERLRFTPSPVHDAEMMRRLGASLNVLWTEFSLKRAVISQNRA